MKKIIFVLTLFAIALVWLAAEEITVTLEFTGVKINGGDVYVAVYDSAESVKNDQPHSKFRLDPVSTTISAQTQLREGYYRVMAFQDENGNGELDTGLFGIPKEPFGISNYSGRGIPGNFEKLKLWIGQGTGKVTVNLAYYR
jgi:uncharacterized protein (DUF2141 family)